MTSTSKGFLSLGLSVLIIAAVLLGKTFFASKPSGPSWESKIAVLHGPHAMAILPSDTTTIFPATNPMPVGSRLTDQQIHEAEGIAARNAKANSQAGEWAARSEDEGSGRIATVLIFKEDFSSAAYFAELRRDANGNWQILRSGKGAELL